MNPYWSPVVAALEPYVPGEQPRIEGLVKLNTNESPYGPSPRALEAMAACATDAMRLYPDPESRELRRAVADHWAVTPERVFVGNGSDEVLAHAFRALLDHDAPILFPDVTYSFYPVYCALFGIAWREVPLSPSFDIVADDYLRANGGIVLANPNAPTGKLLPLADVERVVAANPESVVVLDEAYIDFGGESAVPLTLRYPNLLVVQTLSKSRGLAGLRVGFAIGDPGLVEALDRVKNSFNSYPLGRIAQAGAAAAIRDGEHLETVRDRITATRAKLTADLESLGFEVLPSAANFVFARHEKFAGTDLAAALRERKVLVRHFARPRIDEFVRITIGTDGQCAALITALNAIVAGEAHPARDRQ